ncbi:MAG: AAA family ATPase [Candidatus Aenigmarchaeota archaeon]|nr:AAA family ATPase [Candidatus Aenigmarchaeota archaeon]
MVRLDRITMQGFKSFANRVTIPFPTGFNCVCGPNGSGKSNICDAITFVLGTSSARSIRAEKLQNLLFNGGKNRKPADYCEVTLYLDNKDKQLPGEEEVKITRKISRSGITVYKLDGKTVTRSKLLDLLANAKLSPEGYNIIMQGDVTRIIEMGPLERRGVVDEISGIAEFDEKKEKATRELERVENLVRESMIVVAEKQRLVSRLKSEKETAEKYQELNDKLRKFRASLLKKKISDEEEKAAVINKGADEKTEKFATLEKTFFEAENSLEKTEKSVQKKGDEIIQKSKNYDILRNIDKVQTEILRKHDRIDVNEREVARLKSMAPVASHLVKEVMNLGLDGVYGTVASLVKIPAKYSIALEVAIGRHVNDIVVETDEIAARCIKFLKEKKVGRARFIPLNRIRTRRRKECGKKIIGYAIDLIEFDGKYSQAMEYVLGSTIVVDNIDTARKINGFRIVTLDGDLIETSGAMIGGYYKKLLTATADIQRVEAENASIKEEIKKLEVQLEKLKSLQETESEEVTKLVTEKEKEEQEIEKLRGMRKRLFEERLVMQNEISKLKIEKARIEATLDNLRVEAEEFSDVKEFVKLGLQELQENIRKYIIEINGLGPVNMRAIEEFKTINVEFEEMKKKLDKLLEEKAAVIKIVQEVEKRRYDKFMETLDKISENFSNIYKDLMNGTGRLRLEIENNIDSGLIVEASPAGKNIVNLDSMSGGEKTLTSLAFLFAIMQLYYSPFYILDEVDAALDKPNTRKIVDVVKKYSKTSQFIVITHNDFTIQEADKVFGVSMEDGVSKVFGIELPKE